MVKTILSPQIHVFLLPPLMIPWLRRWKGKAWGIVGKISCAWGVALFLPFGSWGLRRYENRVARPSIEELRGKTALVLMGSTGLFYRPAGQMVWLENAARAQEVLRLYRAGAIRKIILSGSRSADINQELYLDEPVSIAQWLREMGVPAEAIAVEGKSRNTFQNISFSKPLLPPGQPFVLITSAFHMPRALATARQAGLGPVIAYPVDYKVRDNLDWWSWENLLNWERLIFEVLGRATYRALGYSA